MFFLNGIKNIVANTFDRIRKNFARFLELFLIYSTFLFLLLETGYSIVKDTNDTNFKILLLVILFCLLFILFLLRLNFKKIFKDIKSKKIPRPSLDFILLCLYSVFLVLSFVFCKNKNANLYSYLDFGALIVSSILFVRIVSFNRFKKIFSQFSIILSLTSIFFYFLVKFANIPFSIYAYADVTTIVDNYFYIYFDFGKVINNIFIYSTSNERIMSIFWEPGVFATFLLVAIIIEITDFKKYSISKLLLYIFCIMLTYSTAGYLILPFLALLFLSEFTKNKKIRNWILPVAFIFAVLASVLAILFFGDKFNFSNSSFSTRLYSIYYNFLVFLKSPLFGHGFVTASSLYYEIAPSVVTANTSTIGLLLASFGIIGILYFVIPIIGIFKTKSLCLLSKFLMIVSLFLMMSKENHSSLFLITIFYFYLGLEPFVRRDKKEGWFVNHIDESPIFELFFNKGRTTSGNISWSFIVKVLSLLIGLLVIPVFNNFFGDDSSYGVWLTITSILTWITLFDFGFSNGLRTKLSASLQSNDFEKGKKYISVTYSISIIIATIIVLLGFVLTWTLDWNSIFGISKNVVSEDTLRITLSIVFTTIGVYFVLKIICPILDANNRQALSGALSLFSNILLLLFAVCGSLLKDSNKFVVLAILYFFAMNFPLFIATWVTFKGELSKYRPSVSSFGFGGTKSLMTLNAVFFLIQISNIILHGANNFIISSIFDSSKVADYTKYYKIFSFCSTAFTSIFQAPIWVSAAKALENNDFLKIKKLISFSLMVGSCFAFVVLILSFGLNFIFQIWLGNNAPYFSWIYVLIFAFESILNIFICSATIIGNGLGTIKSQAIIYISAAIVKIPLILLLNPILGGIMSYTIVVFVNIILTWPALITVYIEINKKIKIIKENISLIQYEEYIINL